MNRWPLQICLLAVALVSSAGLEAKLFKTKRTTKMRLISLVLSALIIFGAPVSETVTDVTPEGLRFSEAVIASPGGHAILVYEISTLANQAKNQTE